MEQTQIEQGARLQQLIKALNINQSAFAKTLSMTQPNISRMIRGEKKISAEALSRIAIVHKSVNLHWLLTGSGEMFINTSQEKSALEYESTTEHTAAKGKGKLEDLEERIERLEEVVRQLMGDLGMQDLSK